jgi:hypothetical protein
MLRHAEAVAHINRVADHRRRPHVRYTTPRRPNTLVGTARDNGRLSSGEEDSCAPCWSSPWRLL